VRLLFVSTANLCRSPMAERLAAAWASERLGAAAGGVSVASAGLDAPDGQEMDALSAGALMRLGGDPAGFRSRPWTPRLADDADLVLTMTRRERRAVLVASPRSLRRTFTLLEAADLLKGVEVGDLPVVPLRLRAQSLAGRLDAGRAQRWASDRDDIPDPLGRPGRVHEAVLVTIADALRPLTDALFRLPSADG
jgi:protein-tyrosine phosphatase